MNRFFVEHLRHLPLWFSVTSPRARGVMLSSTLFSSTDCEVVKASADDIASCCLSRLPRKSQIFRIVCEAASGLSIVFNDVSFGGSRWFLFLKPKTARSDRGTEGQSTTPHTQDIMHTKHSEKTPHKPQLQVGASRNFELKNGLHCGETTTRKHGFPIQNRQNKMQGKIGP